MQVILLEDVKSLGKKGEVVKVSDGYAKNMLIPKKLGVEATQKNLNELKNQQKRDTIVAQQQLDEAKAYGEKISKETIQLTMKIPTQIRRIIHIPKAYGLTSQYRSISRRKIM